MTAAYRPEIDGLRALAIVLVMLYHAGWIWPGAGFVGVDLFFVLSGFLITRLLLVAFASDVPAPFQQFYARRVLRLLPALLLVCTCVLLAAPWFLPPFGEVQAMAKSAVAAAGFAANLWFWLDHNAYFAPEASSQPLLHLWSLGVEEQFYLFWPLVLWAAWRRQPGSALATALLLILAGASMVANVVLSHDGHLTAFYLMPARVWQFACGAVLAVHEDRLRAVVGDRPRLAAVAGGIGAVLLLGAATWIPHGSAYPGWLALLPTCGGALLLLAIGSTGLWTRLLSGRPLVWIGARSYELYLWHWPLLVFAWQAAMGQLSPGLAFLVLLLAAVLAHFTRAAEQGLRRTLARRRCSARSILVAGLAASLLLALLALAVGGWAKYGPKSAAQQRSLAIAVDQPAAPAIRCMQALQDAPEALPDLLEGVCRLLPSAAGRASDPAWVLWGDSHAMSWSPALLEQADAPPVWLISHAGCAPLDQHNLNPDPDFRRRCLALQRDVLQWLEVRAREGRISTIWLAARWSNLLGLPPLARSQWERERRAGVRWEPQTQVFAQALSRVLDRLARTGVRIVLLESAPEFEISLPTCLFWRSAQHCAMPRERLESYRQPAHELLRSLSRPHPSVRVFDPLPLLCEQQICPPYKEGMPVVSDDNHLSASWARRLASALRPLAAEMPQATEH